MCLDTKIFVFNNDKFVVNVQSSDLPIYINVVHHCYENEEKLLLELSSTLNVFLTYLLRKRKERFVSMNGIFF